MENVGATDGAVMEGLVEGASVGVKEGSSDGGEVGAMDG